MRMKRIAVIALLAGLSVMWPARAKAQGMTGAEYGRRTYAETKKARKRQKKLMKKEAKRQRKAMKKSLKAQKKQAKKERRQFR
jgi:Flp pilus assembly protein TadB